LLDVTRTLQTALATPLPTSGSMNSSGCCARGAGACFCELRVRLRGSLWVRALRVASAHERCRSRRPLSSSDSAVHAWLTAYFSRAATPVALSGLLEFGQFPFRRDDFDTARECSSQPHAHVHVRVLLHATAAHVQPRVEIARTEWLEIPSPPGKIARARAAAPRTAQSSPKVGYPNDMATRRYMTDSRTRIFVRGWVRRKESQRSEKLLSCVAWLSGHPAVDHSRDEVPRVIGAGRLVIRDRHSELHACAKHLGGLVKPACNRCVMLNRRVARSCVRAFRQKSTGPIYAFRPVLRLGTPLARRSWRIGPLGRRTLRRFGVSAAQVMERMRMSTPSTREHVLKGQGQFVARAVPRAPLSCTNIGSYGCRERSVMPQVSRMSVPWFSTSGCVHISARAARDRRAYACGAAVVDSVSRSPVHPARTGRMFQAYISSSSGCTGRALDRACRDLAPPRAPQECANE
jgi:hypothetical protein